MNIAVTAKSDKFSVKSGKYSIPPETEHFSEAVYIHTIYEYLIRIINVPTDYIKLD